ncbi:MAG: ion transporter [Flavobacteriales bacterium]
MVERIHKTEAPETGDWRDRWHEVIFEADTPEGKRFDVVLLILIVISVVAVILESVEAISLEHELLFYVLELIFTGLFTLEYIARMIAVKRPLKYAFSFFGLVDFLSILPTYLAMIGFGTSGLMIIRILRLMRVFRVLKLIGFVKEAKLLKQALQKSRQKISVFIMAVFLLVVILGTLMYIIEGPEHGFTSIPTAIYWAIVTITTVGYGDISPQTAIGQSLASLMMLVGYAIIAVPTGIVGGAMVQAQLSASNTVSCGNCSKEGHADDATFCKFCGEKL